MHLLRLNPERCNWNSDTSAGDRALGDDLFLSDPNAGCHAVLAAPAAHRFDGQALCTLPLRLAFFAWRRPVSFRPVRVTKRALFI